MPSLGKSRFDRKNRKGSQQSDATAWRSVFNGQQHPMQPGDRGDQAEAETVARRVPTLLRTMKPTQHRLPFTGANTDARIGHADTKPIGMTRDVDDDCAMHG